MVTHPNLDPQIAQAQVLLEMTEDPKRQRATELLFSYANASYRYHSTAGKEDLSTEDLFEEWLEGLPAKVAERFKILGYQYCQKILPFTRYVMERNDIGMEAYIKNLMGEEDYAEYKLRLKLLDPENTLEL